MIDILSVVAIITAFAMICHCVYVKQIGYPRKYIKRFKEMYDGMETKRQIAYAAGEVPGDIVFGASKKRPLLAIDFGVDITVKNTPDVETSTGSGLLLNDRLFSIMHATDGDDRLVNLLRDSESAVQDTFFRESSIQTFDDILQTGEDQILEHLIIPCYSEIPVTLSLALGDLAAEYTGGTITFGTDSIIDVAGAYGEGRLGFEQPFIYQHSDAMGQGRQALTSLSSVKPFFGVLLVNNSETRVATENILGNMSGVDMKDDSNEVNYLLGGRNLQRLYRAVPDSVEVLVDDKGHVNTLTAEVAAILVAGSDTVLKYVGLFTSEPGMTKKKGDRPVLVAST